MERGESWFNTFGVTTVVALCLLAAYTGQRLPHSHTPLPCRISPLGRRYQYDPNPRVQEAMSGIWKALVDDPKAALDGALPTLMQDLTQACA